MHCSVTYLLLEIYCVYCFMVKYLETVKSYLTFEDQTWTLNRMNAILSVCSLSGFIVGAKLDCFFLCRSKNMSFVCVLKTLFFCSSQVCLSYHQHQSC